MEEKVEQVRKLLSECVKNNKKHREWKKAIFDLEKDASELGVDNDDEIRDCKNASLEAWKNLCANKNKILDLRKAANLTPKEFRVVVMKYFYGMEEKEICIRMKVKERWVQRLLSSAISKMSDHI